MTTRAPAAATKSSASAARASNLSRKTERDARIRHAKVTSTVDEVPAVVYDLLKGAGLPLDRATSAFMAPRIRSDFSGAPVGLSRSRLALGEPNDPLERAADATARRALDVREPLPFRGTDLAAVRVHTGSLAARAARAVGARAFTIGNDIVFGEGEYRPQSAAGRHLIAHELAHVAQQSGNTIRRQPLPDTTVASPVPPTTVDVPPNKDTDPKKTDADGKETVASADDKRNGTESDGSVPVALGSTTPFERSDAQKPGPRDVDPARGAPMGKAAQDRERDRDPAAKDDVQSPGDLPTSDLALIDEELAEHLRWGAAAKTVGAAGSQKRAELLSGAAAGGAEFKDNAIAGLKMGLGMKLGEEAVAKAAATIAIRLGANAAKLTPLPGIGAIVGGYFAGKELVTRDWTATGAQISDFGKGADVYEKLANTIESISTVLEVASQIANTINGILGVMTVLAWAATAASFGAFAGVAATLTPITFWIGIGTLALDGINAVVLKPLVSAFRALHAFTSEADPRDVLAQSEAIGKSAGSFSDFIGNFAGGLAGGAAAEKGLHLGAAKPPPKVPPHELPPQLPGEGPVITAEPLRQPVRPSESTEQLAGTSEPLVASAADATPPVNARTADESGPSASPSAMETSVVPDTLAVVPDTQAPATQPLQSAEPKPYGPVTGPSFADLNDVVADLNQGTFGEQLEADYTRAQLSATPRRTVTYKQARAEGNRDAARVRSQQNINEAHVQAGHTEAARHTAESGASRAQVGDPSTFQHLHSKSPTRSGDFSLAVTTVEPGGQTRVTSRHLAQEGLIDDAVNRARERSGTPTASGGKRLTPEGQAAAGAEVRWRTEGTGFDQREVNVKRQSGLFDEKARIEASPAVMASRAKKAATSGAATPLQNSPFVHSTATDVATPIPSSPALVQDAADVATQMASSPALLQDVATGTPHVAGPPTPPGSIQAVAAPSEDNPTALSTNEDSPPVPAETQYRVPDFRVAETKYRVKEPSSAVDPTQSAPEEATDEFPETEAASPTRRRMRLPSHDSSSKVKPQISSETSGPVRERVSPNYPAPPGTPDDLVSLQNQIVDTLAARAQAEQYTQLMATQEAHHKQNQEPLASTQQKTAQAITAVDAHKKAVENRDAAVKQRADREAEARAKLDDYPNRASKLTALTTSLKAIAGVTGLASSLPDEPDVLLRVKRGVLQMNADATRFIGQIDAMDKSVADQKAQQTSRQAQISSDAASVAAADDKANDSSSKLEEAKKTTEQLDVNNTDRIEQAAAGRQDGQQTAAMLDGQAKQKQAQAQSLAAAMQTWANAHRQARLDALEQSRKRWEQLGYRVTVESGE